MKKKRIRQRNPKRRDRLWVKQHLSEAYVKFVRSFNCIVPDCGNPAEACHATGKGAGGTWRDLYPACSHHHTGAMGEHTLGPDTFEQTFGVDRHAEAARLVSIWLDEHSSDH